MLRNFFGLAVVGFFLAACGDSSSGTGGGGGSTSQGGGGNGSCSIAADCAAPAGECQVADCPGGVCTVVSVPQGTPAKTQVAGDCKEVQCEAGAPVTHSDDADVSDDGNDCTIDGCSADRPTTDPEMAGAACSQGGNVCDGAGNCVECNVNADCTDPQQPLCDAASHTCIPIDCTNAVKDGNETDVDCGGLCAPCADLLVCLVAADCQSGVCTEGICQVPTCDDAVKNGLETDADCGGGTCPKCGPDLGCNTAEDCAGAECTGMGGTCIPNCVDQVKNNAETDVDCGGGTCAKCKVGGQCDADDANCVDTAYCEAGTCTAKKALADACMGANQCSSGFCTDGVCCQLACGGVCSACDVPGSVGMCSYIALGQDPADECAGNGGADVCNGDGSCAKSNGAMCAASAECASGFCADGVCCDGLCDGLCQACTAAKTGGADGVCGGVMANTDPDTECAASLDCNGAGACEPKLVSGTACTVAAECQSSQCVDGVCCNTACGGVCSACTMALKGNGADGVCGPIQVNTDPQNECAGALSCTGSASCQKGPGAACATASECASNFCVDGVCCNTACGALCQACNLAGSLGTCTNIPNGQDPANECAANKVCTGNGTCN